MRGHVQRTAIAEEHDVGNGMVAQITIDEQRPALAAAAIIGGIAWPIGLVAAIQIDAEDAAFKETKLLGEFPEEFARRTLQK
jgi:hypothetical protein